jgi:hypothetical protein
MKCYGRSVIWETEGKDGAGLVADHRQCKRAGRYASEPSRTAQEREYENAVKSEKLDIT